MVPLLLFYRAELCTFNFKLVFFVTLYSMEPLSLQRALVSTQIIKYSSDQASKCVVCNKVFNIKISHHNTVYRAQDATNSLSVDDGSSREER